jgi:hypothetical protein
MKKKNYNLLPVSVINTATNGGIDAIHAVLKHYEGYISTLAARKLYDEYGNSYLYVDEGLRRRLETKLITAMMTFNAA